MSKGAITKQFEGAEIVERPDPLPLSRKTAPPQPYPIKALGKILGAAAEAIIDIVQCPDAIAAQSVLTTAALAVQAHADVMHPGTGKKRPLSLFCITVAASGERKSAADEFALEPIAIREFDLRDVYETELRAYRDAKAIFDREREAILKAKMDRTERARCLAELGKEPNSPLQPLLTVPEPTLEGLHRLMTTGEPSLGLFNNEAGTFVGGYGMSDEARLRTGSGLSDLWDGKPVKRVRGGEGVTHLVGRRVSLHLMVQPGIADGILADAILQRQGLNSRLLVAAPPSNAGFRKQRKPRPESASNLKRYERRLLQLLRLPQPRKAPDNPELEPRGLPLSKDAEALWVTFADECEADLAPGQRLEPIQAFANKLPEQALRIAGVLELVENPNALAISVSSFERSMELARYYAGEALRLFNQGSVSAEIQRAEKVLHWLHEKWDKLIVGLSHIYQLGPSSVREAALARETMALLQRHHWVVPIEGGANIDGKRHREVWEIVKQ